MPFDISDWEEAANLTDNDAVNKAVSDAESLGLRMSDAEVGIEANADAVSSRATIGELVGSAADIISGCSSVYDALAEYAHLVSRVYAYAEPTSIDAAKSMLDDASSSLAEAESSYGIAGSQLASAASAVESASTDDEREAALSAYASAIDAVSSARSLLSDANEAYMAALSEFVSVCASHVSVANDRIVSAIGDASKTATDYMSYTAGGLEIGHAQSDVRMQLTNEQLRFMAAGAAMASFGRENEIWRMLIDNASISDSLSFGGFSWIRRANGNMTLKWTGE